MTETPSLQFGDEPNTQPEPAHAPHRRGRPETDRLAAIAACVVQVSEALLAANDIDAALADAVDAMRRTLGLARAMLKRHRTSDEARADRVAASTGTSTSTSTSTDTNTDTTAKPEGSRIGHRGPLIVPIRVGQQLRACLEFDLPATAPEWQDAEVAALQRAAGLFAAAIGQHDRMAATLGAERARAQGALADAATLRQREGLLDTVTEATRKLLAGHDFDASVDDVLELLGTALGVIRVALVEDLTPRGSDEPGLWRVTHKWNTPGLGSQHGSWPDEGPWPVDPWRRMRAGEVVISNTTMDVARDSPGSAETLSEGPVEAKNVDRAEGQVEVAAEAQAEGRTVTDTHTVLPVPIFVQGRCWGGLGLTDSPVRHWADHEIAVLKTAAACVGAALERQAAEAERLALQQGRTQEAEALNHLLEGVVQASRAMLDEDDFHPGRQRWLELLGLAVGADAALLGTLHQDTTQPGVASLDLQWSRSGAVSSDTTVPVTTDFVDWATRLRRGETVWAHGPDLLDPASREFCGNPSGTSLLIPVLTGGRTVGWLGFDWYQRREWQAAFGTVLRTAADGLTSAWQRQQALQHMLSERDRRIESEQARAAEAARQAARSRRHSDLLAAVALSAEELASTRNPDECLGHVLQRIGSVVQAERAWLARIDWLPDDAELHGWQDMTHEWRRDAPSRPVDGDRRRVAMRRGDAHWEAWLDRLRAERRTVGPVDASGGRLGSFVQQRSGVVWSLCYPVLLEGRVWGLLGLDHTTPYDPHEEDDLAALQTIASTIGDVLSRLRLEQRALEAERARADESTRLADLLAQVVRSSRTLIDAGFDDFEPALLHWLGEFGMATDAIRTTFYDRVIHEPTGRTTLRMLCEWVRHGVQGSIAVSFASPFVIDPRGGADVVERLASGQPVAVHTEATSGPLRDVLIAQGNATVIAVPIYIDREPWGCLSFDHAHRREAHAGELAVLQTAADMLATIIKRNESGRALLAEREARLAAERERSQDLMQANDALRASLAALGDTASEGGFFKQSLLGIRSQARALTAYLFRCDGAALSLRLVGRAGAGGFSSDGEAGDPGRLRDGFQVEPSLLRQLVADGRPVWRTVDPAAAPQTPPDTAAWHLRKGHKAEALHALLVGSRLVGLVWLVFDDDRPPPDVRRELIHALCQPLALALELAQLARSARRSGERAAVLSERNRLAREVHDGIAQSFLAIQMQLASMVAADEAPVVQAMALARHGLTEARRAVAALRPHELSNRDLPQGVERLLAQMTVGSSTVPVVEFPPDWVRLPVEVEDNLFRIVQEAMNNVLKHARAATVRVELSQAAGEATVLIVDDGIGFDLRGVASTAGYGLEGMQQRARLIGARVDILSRPGSGTQVLVSWTPPAAPTDASPDA